ncbi:FecR family protein [Spirosoma endophyticum]|uniref:FecR family protein n=1 Tax=Spirosoma endophyticum TaxID=662367 RepID=A0A1I1LA73_9BACT|nr:FecR family protein [Spirosoma endophyticum]SFC69865.1 FecR family protein [Spirosoma endophyticum]
MGLPSENFSTVDDFLENDAFRTWVRERRLEDQVYWQQWLVQYPEKRPLYEQAVATLLVVQGKQIELSDQYSKENTKKILDQLTPPVTVVKPLLGWHWGRWVAVASVVCLLIWWQMDNSSFRQLTVFNKRVEQPIQKADWKIVKNVTGQPLVVLLPDNSSVLLSSGSQLRFHKHNTHTLREVYLQGEGFFEVSKNPAKPFLVYTANLTTKVLGTSFQVRSFDKETAAYVKVKTGKVSVTTVDSPGKTVLLTKNEQLSLETKTDKVVKRTIILAKENSSLIVNQPFKFEFTPVPDIFAQLAASYHMPIHYDKQLLSKCTFTGQLNDVPFLEKIRLICLTTESTFEIVDNQVIIQSHGCN